MWCVSYDVAWYWCGCCAGGVAAGFGDDCCLEISEGEDL